MSLKVRHAMLPLLLLPARTGAYEALCRLGYMPFGVVVRDGFVVGTVARADLQAALDHHRRTSRAKDPFLPEPRVEAVMRSSRLLLGAGLSLEHAVGVLRHNWLPALPVAEGGRLVGLLTLHRALARLGEADGETEAA